MKEIPAEILQKIFVHLHQHDKAVCMSVCSAWKYVIENYVLFDIVCLYNKQQFNNFVSKNRREPNQSENIGRLIVDMEHMEGIEMDILPLVILNLNELYFYESVPNYNLRFTNSLSPHSWSKTIRVIKEKSSNIFTTHILKSAVCPNLTEISVQGTSVNLGKEFIGLLSNSPALKSLSLKSFNLSLTDLELLHKTIPLLSSFVLRNGAVECATLPTGVQPMLHIKNLTLEHVTVATNPIYINLQLYLARKYPMIDKMLYHITVDSNANEEYNFTRGFALQIRKIRPHLTSLTFRFNSYFEYIIPVLDNNGCRIKKFGMGSSAEASEVSQLAQSAQVQYIQTFSLYDISSEAFIDYIGAFPALKELKLYCVSNSVQVESTVIRIHRLLEQVGNTLEMLRVFQANVVFDLLSARQYPNLIDFQLQKSIVPKHFDHFISQSFPKLQSLILDDIVWTESSFYLGDLNLAYLELRQKVPSGNPHVLIITISNNEKRRYTSRKVPKHRRTIVADPTAFPTVKSFPSEESDSLPFITFVCNSLRDFFLVNLSDSS